jgi:cytochrome c peroxidase
MKVTQNKADSLKFKIPSLRNLQYSYPYMHDGRFKKLSEVLNHYVNGIEKRSGLAKDLAKKIPLNSTEKVDLIAFLLTLNDKKFVFNKEFGFPKFDK